MNVSVSPNELNIHKFKKSKTIFTISNNRSSEVEISAMHSVNFTVIPRIKRLLPGANHTFTVEHHPSRDSRHFLTFTFRNPDLFRVFHVTVNVEKAENSEMSKLDLECPICILPFNETEQSPRILLCGHTVCSECSKVFWNQGNRQRIICPFDRKTTDLINLDSLTKNFIVLGIIEAKNQKTLQSKNSESPSKLSISDISEIPCAENQYHEATVFCSSCEVDLCENCYDHIHKSKIFINHKKIPLAEKPVQLPKCSVHPYNTAEFKCKRLICRQPSRIFCHTCLLREHKDHSYQHLLEIITSNQEKLQDIIQKINIRQQKLQHKIQLSKTCVQSFEPTHPVYQMRYQSIIEEFELKKARAIAKFESITDKEKQRYQERQEELQHDLQMTTEVSQEMERILKSKTNLFSVDELAERAIALCAVQNEEEEKFISLDQIQTELNEKMELIVKS